MFVDVGMDAWVSVWSIGCVCERRVAVGSHGSSLILFLPFEFDLSYFEYFCSCLFCSLLTTVELRLVCLVLLLAIDR